jgi:hypothetical protein
MYQSNKNQTSSKTVVTLRSDSALLREAFKEAALHIITLG